MFSNILRSPKKCTGAIFSIRQTIFIFLVLFHTFRVFLFVFLFKCALNLSFILSPFLLSFLYFFSLCFRNIFLLLFIWATLLSPSAVRINCRLPIPEILPCFSLTFSFVHLFSNLFAFIVLFLYSQISFHLFYSPILLTMLSISFDDSILILFLYYSFKSVNASILMIVEPTKYIFLFLLI